MAMLKLELKSAMCIQGFVRVYRPKSEIVGSELVSHKAENRAQTVYFLARVLSLQLFNELLYPSKDYCTKL